MAKDKLSIHVKVTAKMDRLIEELSKKHDRTKQAEALRLIKLGLHQEQFASENFD